MKIKFLIFFIFIFFQCPALKAADTTPAYPSFINKVTGKTSVPIWMKQQIEADFKPFRGQTINQKLLDNIIQKSPSFIRIQIKNNVPSFHPIQNREQNDQKKRELYGNSLLRHLVKICSITRFKDLDFIVDFSDGELYPEKYDIPIFVFSKKIYSNKGSVLIPDHSTLSLQEKFHQEIDVGKKAYPWPSKESKVFWRGATTDGFYSTNDLEQYPRFRLVVLNKKFPDLIDAKFHEISQFKNIFEKFKLYLLFKFNDLLDEKRSISEHLKYKYQILIDGNTSSWTRGYWQLMSDCLMLKQTSDNIQWYYQALQPYVHYVPIKNDVSDLIEKVKWAEEHQNEVLQIIKNANQFSKDNLGYEDMLFYLSMVLNEYSKMTN